MRDDPAEALARARRPASAAHHDRLVAARRWPRPPRSPTTHPDVYTTAGLHPHHAADWSDAIAEEIRRRAAHPRCVAIGETGLDWYRDRAPREAQLDAFRAPARDRARARPAGRDPLPRGARTTASRCSRPRRRRRSSCTASRPTARLDEAIERGWYCSFAGNVTYGARPTCRTRPGACRTSSMLLETDAPYLAPVPHRGRPNEPAYVMDTLRVRGRPARRRAAPRSSAVETNAERVRCVQRLAWPRPARSRWRACRSSASRPTRGSGSTSWSTTTSSASPCGSPSSRPDDVVLEVGPGLGVLTAALADAARHVHAIELDRRLEPALARSRWPAAGTSPCVRRRARRRPGGARPRADGLRREPAVQRRDAADRRLARAACRPSSAGRVMIQRELGDRLLRPPGTPAYGAPSVLVQLACEPQRAPPRVTHACSRRRPNVDSALVGFRRSDRWPANSRPRWARLGELVHAGFGTRRKTLANAIDIAGLYAAEPDRGGTAGDGRRPARSCGGPATCGLRGARRAVVGVAGVGCAAPDRPIARGASCNCTGRLSPTAPTVPCNCTAESSTIPL